jgi:hypothetical protein
MTKAEEQDDLAEHTARLAALSAFPTAVREYTVGLARRAEVIGRVPQRHVPDPHHLFPTR